MNDISSITACLLVMIEMTTASPAHRDVGCRTVILNRHTSLNLRTQPFQCIPLGAMVELMTGSSAVPSADLWDLLAELLVDYWACYLTGQQCLYLFSTDSLHEFSVEFIICWQSVGYRNYFLMNVFVFRLKTRTPHSPKAPQKPAKF